MEFAVICPEDHLKDFGTRTKYHLVLAQFCLPGDERRRRYFEFYRRRVERGDVVILDNGAYEGERMSEAKLLEVTKMLEPTAVVLPDSPGNYLTTKALSMGFAELLGKEGMKTEKMVVLHAPRGQLAIFELAYRQAVLYADWIGFSRLTMKYGVPGETFLNRRSWFAKHLQHEGFWDWSKNHHALGMLGGAVPELHRLHHVGFRGCDSSSPVWRGLNGYRYGDPWSDIPFALRGPDYPDLERAEANLKEVLEACQG